MDKPDIAILRPGTLQNQGEFEPIAHLYTRSKLPWFFIPQDVAKFENQPDEAGELIRLWQQKNSLKNSAK